MDFKKKYFPYLIHIFLYVFFIIFAFIQNTPSEILKGLDKIISNSDILITDYIYTAGIGATFVNTSLLGLISIFLLLILKIEPNGSNIMSLWLITGFGMFGKNILNVWPIPIGVWLYSKYKGKPFKNYILTAILGTTLAPTVTQLSLASGLNFFEGLSIGFIIGIGIGFILPPITSHSMNIHFGFNLYNVGFAGGIIATALMSMLRAIGYNFDANFLWHSGSNELFGIFMIGLSLYFLLIGIFKINNWDKLKSNLIMINKETGRIPSDFLKKYGDIAYVNMGLLGIISTIFVLLIKGSLNGPTMGAIFTMIGFGCFGKNILNVIPVIIGSSLSAIVNIMKINSPSMVLSIMFSTGLAPISGYFGWKYGIIAGFLHVSMVMNIGYLHGGLNLYNNGLACGFVAMLLVPIISSLSKKTDYSHIIDIK
ncbi:Protein of uncharacterised function (DUF1576) [Clostridium fallax]|uniref:DUF1576 domain-containing protein n=1 Tax=Clostridium fallax TaxID=1533 RepID=A0A1M4ZIM2_9CLOT|nr:DUF1576 domain-containing protein [Clostridium fallax]SHF17910.1 Protein of unknown function [Clostridium fallax]SQB08094.1 Protein of uncharacterised function (DUF1576) [Clostridium fallax]